MFEGRKEKGKNGKESRRKYTSEARRNAWNPKLMSLAQRSRHVL
jgi:hypothetical protein